MAIVAVTLSIGCGDNVHLISGTYVDVFVTTDGTEEIPHAFESDSVILHSFANGSWMQSFGARSEGHFEVVGEGPADVRILQIGSEAWQLRADATTELSIRKSMARRADAELSNSNTRLNLQYSSLAPWRDGDQLVVYSPEGGCNFSVYGFAPDPQPAFGATAMEATVDYSRFDVGEYLINRDAGDRGYLMQMRDSVAELGRTVEAVRIGDISVSQEPGDSDIAAGKLLPIGDETRAPLVFDVPTFVAARPPREPYDAPVAQLFASIPTDDGQFLEPSAWFYSLIAGRDTAPIATTASYAHIFDREWLWWVAGIQTSAQVALEGTAPTTIYGGLFVRWRAEHRSAEGYLPIPQPRVDLDGIDWTGAELVSPSSVITISQVTPATFQLQLLRIEPELAYGSSIASLIITIESTEPKIYVPASVLEEGSHYVLVVRITTNATPDVEQVTIVWSPLLLAQP